jgi:hypothetical protein
MTDDKKKRLRACFDVLHSTMSMLWNECEDSNEAKVILGKMDCDIFSNVRRLRVLLDVGYDHKDMEP